MIIALLSLIGIPPLGGFVSKYFLFIAVVAPQTAYGYAAAAGLVIGSAISVYYYIRFARIIMDEPSSDIPIKPATPIRVLMLILSVLTVLFSVVAFYLTPSEIFETLF